MNSFNSENIGFKYLEEDGSKLTRKLLTASTLF